MSAPTIETFSFGQKGVIDIVLLPLVRVITTPERVVAVGFRTDKKMDCYSFDGDATLIASIEISPESIIRVSQNADVPLFFIGDGVSITSHSLMHKDLRKIFTIDTPDFDDFIVTDNALVLSTAKETMHVKLSFDERSRPSFGEVTTFDFGGKLKMINKEFAVVGKKETNLISKNGDVTTFKGELICNAPSVSSTIKIGTDIIIGEDKLLTLLPGDSVECFYQIMVAIGKNHVTIIDTDKRKVLVSYNISVSSFYHYQGIVLVYGDGILNMLSLQTIGSYIIASSMGDPEMTFSRRSRPPYDFTEDIYEDPFEDSRKYLTNDNGQFPAFEMGKDIEIY